MADELSQLARELWPYLAKHINGVARPVVLTAGGGGEPGDHARLHDVNSSLDHNGFPLLWTNVSKSGSSLADLATRNYSDLTSRTHDIVSEHTATGSQYQIVGLSATDTIGLLTPAANISGGNTIPISDASGDIWLNTINVDGDIVAGSVVSNYLQWSDVHGTLWLNSGAAAGSATIMVTNPGPFHNHVVIKQDLPHSADILVIRDDTDTDIFQISNDFDLESSDYVSGTTGASIDWQNGTADFRGLTADELVVEAFIAAVKKAHVGALIVTKSMSLTTRQFTVPAVASTGTLYVADIPGLGGMAAFDDDDDVMIKVVSLSEPYSPTYVNNQRNYSDTGGGTTVHYAEQDFEAVAIGGDPTDWRDTGTGNSMTALDLCDVQSVGGTKAFGSTNSGSNFHTHYDGTGAQSLTDYRYTGRLWIGSSSVGIGLTLFSQYESGGTDEYYRIRRYSGAQTFYVANHGDYADPMTGTTDSGYNPAPNTWHRFKIEVEDDGSQTDIRAKFWQDGASEPASWQIDCYDDDATNRGTDGTFGVWLHGASDGAYVDELKVESITGTSAVSTVEIDAQTDDVLIAQIWCLNAATMTPQSGWTSITSQTSGTDKAYWYRKTITSDGTDSSSWTASTGGILAHIINVRAIDTADVVEATAAGTYSSVDNFAASSVTANVDYTALILLTASGSGINTVTPAGMSKVGSDFVTSPDYNTSTIFTETVDSGATGTRTVGLSTSASGAYLMLLLNPKSGTRSGLVVAEVWGTVEATSPVDIEDDEQAYTFTTTYAGLNDAAEGLIIQPDSVVLDYGNWLTRYAEGKGSIGFVEITTIDEAGSPYMQIGTRGEEPWKDQTVHMRAGNLEGISAATGTWGLYVAGDIGQFELSDEVFRMDELEVFLNTDGAEFMRITHADGFRIQTVDQLETKRAYTFYDATYGDIGGLFSYIDTVTDTDRWLVLKHEDGSYDSFVSILSNAGGSNDSEVRIWASNDDYYNIFELHAQRELGRLVSSEILLDGVVAIRNVGSKGTPLTLPHDDFTDAILVAEDNGGGFGIFNAETMDGTQYTLIDDGEINTVARVEYVAVSGSSNVISVFNATPGNTHTSATFNSITMQIGISAGGGMWTKRASGSNTYDITIRALWR